MFNVNILQSSAIALALAAVCGGSVLAGVFVRTGPDGSVTVVTDRIQVENRGGRSQVSVDNRLYPFNNRRYSVIPYNRLTPSNFISQSSSSSISHASAFIPARSLQRLDYVLMVNGSGDVKIDGRHLATLRGQTRYFHLDPYLTAGAHSIRISGTGWTSLQAAVVGVRPGNDPRWDYSGNIVGANRVIVQQTQSNSGYGAWEMDLDLYVD